MTSEGDSIGIKSNEVYMTSGFSLGRDEPEVSHDFRWCWWSCVIQHLCVCVLLFQITSWLQYDVNIPVCRMLTFVSC
jgi:hypothetical protein